jgi:hypothetical protein
MSRFNLSLKNTNETNTPVNITPDQQKQIDKQNENFFRMYEAQDRLMNLSASIRRMETTQKSFSQKDSSGLGANMSFHLAFEKKIQEKRVQLEQERLNFLNSSSVPDLPIQKTEKS